MAKFSELIGQLGQKWQELDPILKTTLLAGGGSAAAGGILSALSKRPRVREDRAARRRRILGNALLMGALGGGATAGIGYGLRSLGTAMPAGSKPPGDVAKDLWHGPGRGIMAGLGVAAANKFPSKAMKGDRDLLANKLKSLLMSAEVKGIDKDTIADDRFLKHYMGGKGMFDSSTSDIDRVGRQTIARQALDKGGVKLPGFIGELRRSGVDVDPVLLRGQKSVRGALSKIPGIGERIAGLGGVPAWARRVGLGRLGGLATAGLLAPELLGTGGKMLGIGDGEGTL